MLQSLTSKKDLQSRLRRVSSRGTWNNEAGTSKGQSPFSRGNKEARQRGTLLTRGGGKGGWIRKLVNSITGNPLE